MKSLIQKLNKEFPGSINPKEISVELINDLKIEEPIDYFSS